MTKRLLSMLLIICMVIIMTPSVLAATYVAKVGEVECADAAALVSALNSASGEVTVEIYDKITTGGVGLNNPNITKLSFVGKDTDAEICVDGISYIDVRYTNYPIEYADLILSHINAGQNIDGYLPQYFSTYNGADVTYTHCSFPNGVTACGSTPGTTYTFDQCTFNNTTSGQYSLWIYGNSTNVIIDGGTFSGVRGIKMYSEGSDDFSDLSVSGATFSDTITEKHAIVLTKGESITLTGNTFNNTTGTVQVDDDYASTIEGKTVTIDGTEYTVDSTDFKLDEVTYVAEVNGTKYSSLQAAITKATEVPGDYEIILESGINEENPVVIHQTEGVNITIRGNGEDTVFSGYIEVYGHCRNQGEETLIFDGIVFQTNEKDHVFIEQTCMTSTSESAAKCYPHNITVQNCSFVATDDALNTAVGMKFRYGYNIKVADTTATGLHSLMQNYAGQGLTIDDVTITGGKNGIALGTSQNVTVSELMVDAVGYGLRVDAENATTITVSDCEIEAFIPVVVRKATANVDLVFDGDNAMTATNTDGIWCAVGASEYEENGVMPSTATGTVNVKLNDIELDAAGIYGEKTILTPEAKIGEKTYEKFVNAVEEAQRGQTIQLLRDVTVENISGNGVSAIKIPTGVTIDGNRNTITFDGIYNGSATAAFWNNDGSYTVKNLTFALENEKSNGFAIHMAAGGLVENVIVNANFHSGVFAGSNTTIRDCVFNTSTTGSYYGVSTDGSPDNIVIDGCEFNGNRAAMLYGTNVTFTDNTINGSKGLSIAATSGTVSGNTFAGARAMSVSALGTTITNNIIGADSVVESKVAADLSANYWGSETGPSENQIINETDGVEAIVNSYYSTKSEEGTLGGLIKIGAFTITFNSNGGECSTSTLTTGDDGKLSELPDAVRPGYAFDGWYNRTEKVTIETVYTADTTLTATWTANTYTVTLVTNGGTIRSGNVTEYTYGVGAVLPTNVTRSGYTFDGWYDNAACKGSPVTEINVTDINNKTFYAKWSYIYLPIIPSNPTYPPVVNSGNNGDVVVTPKNPQKGDTVTITPNPDKGFEVDEIMVTDKNGNSVTVADNGNGTYSFKQPSSKVNIEVTFKEIDTTCPGDWTCPMYGYTDLDRTAWYHDGVHYCIEHDLMGSTGTSTLTFEPNLSTTRAMIVTILWRLEGEPIVNYEMTFEDVADGMWYTEAIRWAKSTGVVEGYSAEKFGPNDTITREQLATIIWRYAKDKGYDLSVGENTNILSYGDAFDVAEWAIPAKVGS